MPVSDPRRAEGIAIAPAAHPRQLPNRAVPCFSPYCPSCGLQVFCPGVHRISLLGSLATAKAIPKAVDLLVTIDGAMELTELARISRQLMGSAQTVNLGADIFLADATGRYLGRVCRYRECHPRVRCLAQHCGQKDHLNDDLHVVTLSQELITSPSVDLWPKVARRVAVPADVENLLLTKLERDQ